MKKLETDLKPIDREIKKLEEHLNELNKRVELHVSLLNQSQSEQKFSN